MTKRERLAMEWALRELRRCNSAGGAYARAACVLRGERGATVERVSEAARDAEMDAMWPPYRILRARLALALRAMLRADSGDYGRVTGRVCSVCQRVLPRLPPPRQAHYDQSAHGDTRPDGRPHGPVWMSHSTRRYTPLWEQARR